MGKHNNNVSKKQSSVPSTATARITRKRRFSVLATPSMVIARYGKKTTSKIVRFAPKLETVAESSPYTSETWYDDDSFNLFLADCRTTVQAVHASLKETGDLRGLKEDYTILGIEHFISRERQQNRQDWCRKHTRAVMQEQQKQRERASEKKRFCDLLLNDRSSVAKHGAMPTQEQLLCQMQVANKPCCF